MSHASRRRILQAAAILGTGALGGCMSSMSEMPVVGGLFGDGPPTGSIRPARYAEIYASYAGEQFPVEPFDFTRVDPVYLRQQVAYVGAERPGTIVVDPHERHLYLVERNRKATRYGVGVGREGFAWSGEAQINMRRAWPDWIPPREMVERDPEIRSQLVRTPRGLGVPGGPRSPLGARAMYLFAGGDTGYRIHGTTEPETIGTNVSSGCVRMVNQDVIHLYGRAAEGAKVVVLA